MTPLLSLRDRKSLMLYLNSPSKLSPIEKLRTQTICLEEIVCANILQKVNYCSENFIATYHE